MADQMINNGGIAQHSGARPLQPLRVRLFAAEALLAASRLQRWVPAAVQLPGLRCRGRRPGDTGLTDLRAAAGAWLADGEVPRRGHSVPTGAAMD